ncbi:hypothetical protein [Tatumella ptyseos]|uniref:hypothetical protein n=1 Tax=Tatumella ptyseos TaxID=82987 RepID=UPI0026EB52FB|nr:hypothetical protein [Tatumella ptyseos]WKX25773.1 hypothetical protein QJR74_10695 [Tatumella ptyseos]
MGGHHASLEQAGRARPGVTGLDAGAVRADVQQVRGVLAGAHQPVETAGLRVIATQRLGSLAREPQPALCERQPVRTEQRPGIQWYLRLSGYRVDHVDTVEGAIAGGRGTPRPCDCPDNSHRAAHVHTLTPRL